MTIAVDLSSRDASEALLSAAGATQVLTAREGTSFGSAVSHGAQFAPAPESDDEWLWLLGHDNAPRPDALERLLGAIEIAPSVAVAGPKLMAAGRPDLIAGFGETISTFGATVALVDHELDQAQHDTKDDVLGVAAAGMLVRRSLWARLGGFDPGLPSIDAALDFCLRVRLAGYRVVLVPGAQVESAGGPELFGRKAVSTRRRFRISRAAQLHRRLVYAPGWAVALHWLSLLPLAALRSIGALLAKRPGVIGGEFRAAAGAAFTGGVGAARRNLARTRQLGWSAIAGLRMPSAELRERRAQAHEAELAESEPPSGRESAETVLRPGFVAHGGLWIVLLLGAVGALAYGALLSANAVSGGGLLPLSGALSDLWGNIGYGWREVGTGLLGAADPFAAVLAVLGSLTFWAPSLSIVLLYLLALPLAALGAWFCARPFSRAPWLPSFAALAWALAPPFLAGLSEGRLGAVIAHLLLPWLILAGFRAWRSWAAAAAAALLLAAISAGAPSLVPALLALWVAMLLARPGAIHRLVGIPVPALALFGPLLIQQVMRGNPLGLLADPGVPLAVGTSSGWRLALGDATGGLLGWPALLEGLSTPGIVAPVLVLALLAPLGFLALLALFLPGSARAVPAMFVALLGYLTAVACSHIRVGSVGTESVTVWAGSGLSLFWLGLVGSAVVGLGALGKAGGPLTMLTGLATAAVALPLAGALLLGTSPVAPATGRILPALVTAEAAAHPTAGTLVATAEGRAGISVRLERGLGAALDDQSTLVSTTTTATELEERLAALAGNLAARGGYAAAAQLEELDIPFVLVPPGDAADETYRQMVDALDGNEALTPIGTTANGLLWKFEGASGAQQTEPGGAEVDQTRPGNLDTPFGRWYLIVLCIVFGITLLLAFPTSRPRRRPSAPVGDDPAAIFEEDEHD